MIGVDRKSSLFLYKRKQIKKARKMSNEQLCKALWVIRDQNELIDNFTKESQKSFLIEEIYSNELKRRELLEWALNSKPQ